MCHAHFTTNPIVTVKMMLMFNLVLPRRGSLWSCVNSKLNVKAVLLEF